LIESDHDTFTNFQEFQNGTDPVKSVSHPLYDQIPLFEVTDERSRDEYLILDISVVFLKIVIILSLLMLVASKRKRFQDGHRR